VPDIPALLLNLTKVAIPDGELLGGVRTPHSLSVSPRWNCGLPSTLANGLIASFAVVDIIARGLIYLTGNLRQQRRKHPAIMNVARGNLNDHNLFHVFIDSQIEVAPKTSLTASMLLDMPLPYSIYSKACGINAIVARMVVQCRRNRDLQCPLLPTIGAIVRDRQVESNKIQHQGHEALSGSEGEAIEEPPQSMDPLHQRQKRGRMRCGT